jgi:hypothetical protein
VTHRLISALFALALVACGGGDGAPAKSANAVVEIPEPSDEPAASTNEDAPVPPARRTERVASVDQRIETPPEVDSPWTQPPPPWGGAGSGGGPDCDRAADCCLKFVQKSGADPSLISMCDSVRHAPASSCSQLLSSFRSLAPQTGIQCN